MDFCTGDHVDVVPGRPHDFIYDTSIIDNLQDAAWEELAEAVRNREFLRVEGAMVALRRVVYLNSKSLLDKK